MNLKKILIAGILFSTAPFASAVEANKNGVWADGYVSYKHPDGRIVDRACSLFVPSRGMGSVKLKCGDFETSTSEFYTTKNHEKTTFAITFRDVEGAPKGSVAHYRGAYLRGTNKALYYGDVYGGDANKITDIEPVDAYRHLSYVGGFMFSKATKLQPEQKELQTVDYVDLDRYLGQWYEIAAIPQIFQKDCFGTTANYSKKDNGEIEVVNTCRKGSLDGRISQIVGSAKVVDPKTNAKLEVTFFWPFKGDYWVIDLDPDYQWAVVGHPSKDYLWILSRDATLDGDLYQEILDRLTYVHNYDISRLKTTRH